VQSTEQIADRWHLLKNVRETLVRTLDRNHKYLPRVKSNEPEPQDVVESDPIDQAAGETTSITQPPQVAIENDRSQPRVSDCSPRCEQIRQINRAKRLERYEKVVRLHQEGMGIWAISRHLGICRRTVRRYLQSGVFPEIAQRPKKAIILDPYKPYVQKSWIVGHHNGMQLWREIREQGFTGAYQTLAIYIRELRAMYPLPATTKVRGRKNYCEMVSPQKNNFLLPAFLLC